MMDTSKPDIVTGGQIMVDKDLKDDPNLLPHVGGIELPQICVV
jgi:hypothetical protein